METFLQLMPWIWGAIFVVTSLIELKAKDIDALWFSISALLLLIIDLIHPGLGLIWQLLIFISTTLVLILTVGRFAKKRAKNKNISIESDTLVGREITILEDCNEFEKGSGNIDDVVWITICQSGYTLRKGDLATIVAIDGNKLIVKTKENLN